MRAVTGASRLRRAALLALLALAAGLAGCQPSGDEGAQAPSAPPPPEVVATEVRPHEVPLTFEYAGRVAGFTQVEVRARVGGVLLQRAYREGETVDAGAILFRIDPRPYEVAKAQAEAQLQQTQAQLAQARRTYERAQELFERRVGAEATRDEALAQVQLTEAQVAAAQASLQSAELDLSYTIVRAPVRGVTSLEVLPEGSLVSASGEQSLLTTITQLDPAYVNFSYTDVEYRTVREIFENRSRNGRAPEKLTVELNFFDGGAYEELGEVNFTDQTVDPATGTIRARAIFPNEDGALLPGQFVRVIVRGLSLNDAITVPTEAIGQGPQGPYVYVVAENGNAETRPIRTGRQVNGEFVVSEGLQAGDRVVTEGVIRVRPNMPVRIAEAAGEEPVAADEQAAGEAPAPAEAPAAGQEGQ